MTTRNFTTKANALRAAKTECKKVFGKIYEAHEGFDFVVWSQRPVGELRNVWFFRLNA